MTTRKNRKTRESFQERLAEAIYLDLFRRYRQLLNRLMAIEQKLGLIPQDGFDRANGTSEPVIKRVIGPATEDELTSGILEWSRSRKHAVCGDTNLVTGEAFRAGAAWERRRR